ncbi:hypothetical protein HDC37_000356 [Microbacterium sp. AK009]|uniref:CPBP family intramembrane glutamic endopeptidase n=1 Tax=Microbacterium sp. AK009 TaxID=2723068 RepID=UPI0015CC65BB|nr:type II CAAX endopeptidase family protein [Microbacterium sp. AK009]NYF15544.1 hypothetical protein [Microbacterium sp. AK009]
MLDHSSDVDTAVSRRTRRPRTDWRLGGSTVRAWREWLLAAALVALGIGVLVGALIEWAWDASVAPLIATGVVGLAMLAVVVLAFSRSRPVGLLRLRPLDLLWGIGLGVAVRIAQGFAAGPAPLPSTTTIDGAPASEWWTVDLIGAVVFAPVVEELFFRGVLLVAVFTILRRPLGHLAAGIAASLVSTGLFVLLHALPGPAQGTDVVGLTLLSLVASGVVLLTGRIWGAIVLHAVYNTSFVVLTVAGTVLA